MFESSIPFFVATDGLGIRMDSNLDDLTIAYEEDGKVRVRELDRRVLQDGRGWATMAFLSQEWENATEQYAPPRVHLRRYRKRGGRYQLHSKFNLPAQSQITALKDALVDWDTAFPVET